MAFGCTRHNLSSYWLQWTTSEWYTLDANAQSTSRQRSKYIIKFQLIWPAACIVTSPWNGTKSSALWICPCRDMSRLYCTTSNIQTRYAPQKYTNTKPSIMGQRYRSRGSHKAAHCGSSNSRQMLWSSVTASYGTSTIIVNRAQPLPPIRQQRPAVVVASIVAVSCHSLIHTIQYTIPHE
jgi:hypothetical protein